MKLWCESLWLRTAQRRSLIILGFNVFLMEWNGAAWTVQDSSSGKVQPHDGCLNKLHGLMSHKHDTFPSRSQPILFPVSQCVLLIGGFCPLTGICPHCWGINLTMGLKASCPRSSTWYPTAPKSWPRPEWQPSASFSEWVLMTLFLNKCHFSIMSLLWR